MSIIGMALWHASERRQLRTQIDDVRSKLREAESHLSLLTLGLAEAKGRGAMIVYSHPRLREVGELTNQLDRLLSQYKSLAFTQSIENDSVWLRVAEASVAQAKGQYQHVLDLLSLERLEANERDARSRVAEVASGYRLRGDAFFSLHRWSDSRSNYERAVALVPTDLDSLLKLANCLSFLNLHEPALAKYNEIIGLYEALDDVTKSDRRAYYGGVLNNRSYVYGAKNDLASSLADLDEAVKVFRDLVTNHSDDDYKIYYAGILNNRGYVRQQSRNASGAIADFTIAIDILTTLLKRAEREDLNGQLARVRNNYGHSLIAASHQSEGEKQISLAKDIIKRWEQSKGGSQVPADLLEIVSPTTKPVPNKHALLNGTSSTACFSCHPGG